MRLQFLGTGDAFGTGGRFNTCFHVTAEATSFLIDCGASSMIAIRRFGVDPNTIRTIFITHMHGDHFAGIPFLILDAQLYSRRTEPLTIAGPPGIADRLTQNMEVLFPGSSTVARKFALDLVELPAHVSTEVNGVGVMAREVNGVTVTPFPVEHACGSQPYAYRFACDGKVLSYTGDTEWCDALIDCARQSDLFVAEALFFDKRIKWHLDYASLNAHLGAIGTKRLILTHLGPDMFRHTGDVDCEIAEDGLVVEF